MTVTYFIAEVMAMLLVTETIPEQRRCAQSLLEDTDPPDAMSH
jgi:hypothetical protein